MTMAENRAVLASIKPKWCELIASGKKTIEVRKTRPKTEEPFKVYMYCTKPKKRVNVHGGLFCFEDDLAILNRPGEPKIGNPWGSLGDGERLINGKVIGEFLCDRVYDMSFPCFPSLMKASCLSCIDIEKYAGYKNCYGWHILDLVIYDEPKELGEFYTTGTLSNEDYLSAIYDGSGDPIRSSYSAYLYTRQLRRPPQSWCYVDANTRR